MGWTIWSSAVGWRRIPACGRSRRSAARPRESDCGFHGPACVRTTARWWPRSAPNSSRVTASRLRSTSQPIQACPSPRSSPWLRDDVLALLLAASSALIWGAGDFCGGKATRRSRAALPVTVVSQVAGLPVLALGVLLISAPSPQPSDVGWGALAGMAGFVGIVLLYRGLAAGAMAIFAPITAVAAAVVPLGVGLVLDDQPGTLALVGVCCAIIAIALMSLQVAGSGRHAVVTPR